VHPVPEALPGVEVETADTVWAGEQAEGGGGCASEELRFGRGHLLEDRQRPGGVGAGVVDAGEESGDEPFHFRAVRRVVVQASLVGDEDELVVAGHAGAVDGDDGGVEAAKLQLDAFDVAVDAEYASTRCARSAGRRL